MSYKQAKISFVEASAVPVHAEENRLAKRLFQLENRVTQLENRVEEMGEMLQMLIMMDSFGSRNAEFSVGFCSCEADQDDNEDEEDEDEDDF